VFLAGLNVQQSFNVRLDAVEIQVEVPAPIPITIRVKRPGEIASHYDPSRLTIAHEYVAFSRPLHPARAIPERAMQFSW
jgi:hypothetical protein